MLINPVPEFRQKWPEFKRFLRDFRLFWHRIQERDKIQAQDFIFINPDPSFRGSYNLLFRFLIRKLMKFPHVVPLCFISWPLQLSTTQQFILIN